MGDVTQILSQIEAGHGQAAGHLLPLVYDELRRLAAAKMAGESPNQTLQATGLVHEAYLRLVDHSHPDAWRNRVHFFCAAAEAMRRILVERARSRATAKRGAAIFHEPLDASNLALPDLAQEVLDIHNVLDDLAAVDQVSADLVKLRYFTGLTMREAAEALCISERRAYHVWAYARSWLRRQLAAG